METKQAVEKINELISKINFESDEDEGAWEWQGHLEDVRTRLQLGEMTVEQAEESLGVKLI